METESFPIINDDETQEIHSIFYLNIEDKQGLLYALDLALASPKTKFLPKRFIQLQELRKQIKNTMK